MAQSGSAMGGPVVAVTSMATRAALSELASAWERKTGVRVALEASGGVEVSKRLASGEAFDLVFLGSDALDAALAAGDVVGGTKRDLFRSATAVAVKAGARKPDISTEPALMEAVRGARTIGYSTGPSGRALAALFERWGIASEVSGRVVVPAPGTPVGALIARGEVELGFQQRSELLGVEGIDIIGDLPSAAAIVTVFSGALGARGAHPDPARAFLEFAEGPEAAETKKRYGLSPAI